MQRFVAAGGNWTVAGYHGAGHGIADYVDRAARWLGEFCNIVVVAPETLER